MNIDVKNVLRVEGDFSLTLDNPAFSVVAPSVRIPGKKAGVVAVKFAPVDTSAAASTVGKLIVTCNATAELPPWVFYLNGQV